MIKESTNKIIAFEPIKLVNKIQKESEILKLNKNTNLKILSKKYIFLCVYFLYVYFIYK